MLDLGTLIRIPHVEQFSGFDISPTGDTVVYSWNKTGRWELYSMPLHAPYLPHQLTHDLGAKFCPKWSPDGSKLAYIVDLDGSENYDIYMIDQDTRMSTNLTPNTPHAIQPNFSWSPDSSHLAFSSNQDGVFNTYILPVSGGSPTKVLDSPFPDRDVQWSPDGRWLGVICDGRGQDSWAFIVPSTGGESKAIGYSGEPICVQDSCWSPDSRQLVFVSDIDGNFDTGLFDLESGEIRWIHKGNGDDESPDWSPDGKTIALVHKQGPLNHITILDVETGEITSYQVAAGIHHSPKFTPDNHYLILVFENPAHPADLWKLSLTDGGFSQISFSLPKDNRDTPFSIPEHIHYDSTDGTPVPALLYQPQGNHSPAPAVIYIHGGPSWLSQVTWDPLVQHMISRGWIVLAPNYRGSTGYGREWQTANRFKLGSVDTDDVVAGVPFLIQSGLAIPNRIAPTGRSYGGYLTMACLTWHPGLWAVGAAVVPFLNWFTGHRNSREDLQHWDLENFGDPEKDSQMYYDASPFFSLHNVQAPVQLICGENDPRCPASESTQARDKLLSLGKACDLILYEGEGHAFLKIENVQDSLIRQVEFLAAELEKPLSSSEG